MKLLNSSARIMAVSDLPHTVNEVARQEAGIVGP